MFCDFFVLVFGFARFFSESFVMLLFCDAICTFVIGCSFFMRFMILFYCFFFCICLAILFLDSFSSSFSFVVIL